MANLLDWIKNKVDQDDEKKGVQLVSPKTRKFIKEGIQRVKDNKSGYSYNVFGSLGDMAVDSSRQLGIGDTVGYGLAGASEIPSAVFGGGTQKNQRYDKNMTQSQDNARRAGKFIYGQALTSPLRGPSLVSKGIGMARDAGIGAAFGAGSNTIGAGLQGRLPTIEEIKSGATQGAENSWVFPATSAATNSLLKFAGKTTPFLNKFTDEAMRKSSSSLTNKTFKTIMSKIPGQMLKSGVRETLETPLETAYFASQEDGNFVENYKNRFVEDAITNFVIGSGRAGLQLSPTVIKSLKTDVGAKIDADAKKVGVTPDELLASDGDKYRKMVVNEVESREQLQPFILEAQKYQSADDYATTMGTDKNKQMGIVDSKYIVARDKVDRSTPEYKQLFESIWREGIKEPVIVQVKNDGTIETTEGSHRISIAKEMGMGVPVIVTKGDIPGLKTIDDLYNTSKPQETKSPEIKQKEYQKPFAQRLAERGIQTGQGYTVGGTKIDFEKLMTDGWKPDQIDYAIKLANESPTTLKNPEGYVRGILKSQYPTHKIVRGDNGYMDSLVGAKEQPPITFEQPRIKITQPEAPKVKVEQPKESLQARTLKMTAENKDAILKEHWDRWEQTNPKKIEKLINDIESGKADKNNFISNTLNLFKQIPQQFGIKVGTLENYVHRTTTENAQKIVDDYNKGIKPEPDTPGSILSEPSFAKKRTGALTDYDKSILMLKAYSIEATKNIGLSDVEKARLQKTSEIKEEIKKRKSFWRNLPWSKRMDYVTETQNGKEGENPVKLDDENAIVTGFKENVYSAAELSQKAGNDFYNRFFKPFRDFEQTVGIKTNEILKMDSAQLRQEYESLSGRKISDRASDADIRSYLINRFYAKQKAEATNAFIKEIENSKFEDKRSKDLVNIIYDQYIGDGIRLVGSAEKIAGIIRKNQSRATLGLNVVSAIQNIFEIKRAASLVDAKSFLGAVKDVATGKDFTQEFGVDSLGSSVVGKEGRVGKAIQQYDDVLFKFFGESEKLKDNVLLASFKRQGIKKGLSGVELNDYVIKKFDKYAIKYGTGQDIGLYRSPVFKTLFQYAHYPIKDMAIFAEKLKGATGGDVGDAKYLAKYTFASIVQMALLKLTIGDIGFGGQTGTPADLAVNISEGEIPFSPIVNSAFQTAALIHANMTGVDDFEKDQIKKKLTRSAAMQVPVPSNQVYFKTIKAAQNVARGYQETYTGNVANPTSRDPLNIAKTLVLGPSYDPQRQAYIDRYLEGQKRGDQYSSAGLNKAESNVYRNLTTNKEKEDFYNTTVAGNQRMVTVKNKVKEAGKEKKPGIFARIMGSEEKQIFDTSTPAMKALQLAKIDEKIKYGEPLTPEETNLKYFDKYNNMPTGSRYELREKEKEGYKVASSLVDNEFVPQEQKEAIYRQLETSEEELNYYDIASAADSDQYMFIEDEIASMSKDERAEFLLMGRSLVNGKQMITDTLVNKLYKDGLVSKSERDALKSVKFVKDNTYTGEDAIKIGDNTYRPEKIKGSGSGSAKGFGTDNMVKAKLPSIGGSSSSFKISSGDFIKAPKSSAKTIKVSKPNLQSGKNWRKVRLKY